MALFSPILNGWQGFTDGGVPLNGGLIYTYLATTSTPANTYFDSGSAVAHSNPIVLGSDGRPPGEIWLTESVAYKFVLFDSLLNPIDSWDNIDGIPDVSSNNWVPVGASPIFVNASQFQLAGNFVSTLPVGIRIQYFLTGTPFYGSVSAVSFGGGFTTVTVSVDSVPLNSGLNGVNVSALSPVDTSVPVKFANGILFNQTISVNGLSILSGGATLGNNAVASTTTLDWYQEQITFTPTYRGLTTPGVTVYTTQKGVGTRIGNLFFFQIELSVTSNTGTGTALIGGFPYTADTSVSAVIAPIRSNTTLTLVGTATTSTEFTINRADTAAAFSAPAAVNNTFIMTGYFPIQ